LVVDREDLNIYEKMCCVVLARFIQDTEDDDLTMADLAKHMGVEEIVAKGAFYSLKKKGILESQESEIKPGTIIKANDVKSELELDMPLTYNQKLDRVFEIIEENINEREAKIILGFAGNDLEKIKEKYKIAQSTQFKDKIEVLIHELQKKEHGRIIKKEEVVSEPIESFDFNEEPQTQINTYKINLMKKYAKK
jgi:DNA-binding transcriptional regulator YhcF (GntR family)